MALLEQAKKLRSEPWKQRQILDHKLIKRTAYVLKYLQEHLAKRVIVLGSIGDKSGRMALENSMRILVNPLQHQVTDAQVQYLGHEVIGNVEKIDELKENVIYIMENLNFIQYLDLVEFYNRRYKEILKKSDGKDLEINSDVMSQGTINEG